MPTINRQCKAYEKKPGIEPDVFSDKIQVNCANCQRFNGERCRDEIVALNMNNPELIEPLKLCDW